MQFIIPAERQIPIFSQLVENTLVAYHQDAEVWWKQDVVVESKGREQTVSRSCFEIFSGLSETRCQLLQTPMYLANFILNGQNLILY